MYYRNDPVVSRPRPRWYYHTERYSCRLFDGECAPAKRLADRPSEPRLDDEDLHPRHEALDLVSHCEARSDSLTGEVAVGAFPRRGVSRRQVRNLDRGLPLLMMSS